MLEELCAPAILYIAFSLTQIIIDIFKEMYNTAFFKFIVMVVFSIALNILCKRGLGVISWFIVFVPFIMMTIITTMLLFVFGLSPASGGLDYTVDYPNAKNDVVVVTNSGVNQPYEDGNEVQTGTYTMPPTADEVNNYNK
tara:strand:+ start:302 stop:721 length:420 start_codon:yes stop_codon:yes gene_type:complete